MRSPKESNRANAAARQTAFLVSEFPSWRTGAISWRVTGSLDGKRIRETFVSKARAEARRFELEGLRLGIESPESPRVTTLTPEQLKVAEWVFARVADPAEVRRGWEWWEKSGRAIADAREVAAGLTIADAAGRFRAYVEAAPDLRPRTRGNLMNRVGHFEAELGSMLLGAVTPEVVEQYLNGRKVSPATKVNDRLALSRFFSWCMERPQRLLPSNPATEVKVATEERGVPLIYSDAEVRRLLVAARNFQGGRYLKFTVLQLFGGMRPTEALRFQNSQVVDGHMRIEGKQSKTGRPRTVDLDPILAAWLKICPPGPVCDSQRVRAQWKEASGVRRWIPDGLRHTAISHFFRRCGSYGLTAEWAGNSEAVIRAHYAARTTLSASEAFWTLYPTRAERRAVRAAMAARKPAAGLRASASR